jgi:hypothetical protein
VELLKEEKKVILKQKQLYFEVEEFIFRIIFGATKKMHTYLRLKIRVLWGGFFTFN